MSLSGPSVIWMARHGERLDKVELSWFTKPQRSYDDPPLADRGRLQAKELGQRLAEEHIDHIISSPFERCVETASIISGERTETLPIKIEPGVCEVLIKYPPGYLSATNLKEQYPFVDETYQLKHMPAQAEECDRAVIPRIKQTMDKLLSHYSDEVVLFVGHGASVGGMHHVLTGDWVDVGLCTLSKLTKLSSPPGRYKCELLADDSHLSDRTNLRV